MAAHCKSKLYTHCREHFTSGNGNKEIDSKVNRYVGPEVLETVENQQYLTMR